MERDRLVAEQAETIRDLRTRLDREAEERRQLIAILTDQRNRPCGGGGLDECSGNG